MLTPRDVSARVEEVKRLRGNRNDQLAALRAARAKEALFLDVLQEIARGSIDPRSLAIAALEVERK